VLRFGVHDNGNYNYNEYPITEANTGQGGLDLPIGNLMSYLVVCVYDSGSGICLVVNNRLSSTEHPVAMGGVTANDVPIYVGAEPQSDGASRFHFNGKIQQLSVQQLGEHCFYPESNTFPERAKLMINERYRTTRALMYR
jgi:hypothetical protein